MKSEGFFAQIFDMIQAIAFIFWIIIIPVILSRIKKEIRKSNIILARIMRNTSTKELPIGEEGFRECQECKELNDSELMNCKNCRAKIQ